MNSFVSCLTRERLQQLSGDELSPQELQELEEHVTHCESCRRALEEVAAEPSWRQEVRDALAGVSDPEGWSGSSDYSTEDVPHDADGVVWQFRKLLGPTDDPRMLGRIGPYEIVGILGRGGMGVVFKAFDGALNRYVAIKMLLPHLAASGAARKRFAREAQAAAAVVHDHVMPIHSVAEWQGVPYLVMPYRRGVSLQKRLNDEGPLEVREILRIGMQTAAGLAAAHAQGLVHRDVKPANILLDDGVERVTLTDFGLARAVDDASLTRIGVLAGTPQYMSPEQARGKAVNARSDLFSFGSVLYAMCTGRSPFRADSSLGVLRLIEDDEPTPIREINPEIPEWLCAIVTKLLAKQPDDRFSSASEVSDLLESCLAHVQQPTAAALPSSLSQPRAVSKGHKHLFMGVLVVIAALALGLVAMFAFQAESPSLTDAEAIAEQFLVEIKGQKLPFLNDAKHEALRTELHDSIARQFSKPLSTERRKKLVAGITAFVQREFNPAEKDALYLDFPNRFATLKWELGIAMSHTEPTQEQSAQLAAQRNWMREKIKELPESAKFGIRHQDELAQLETLFDDPLNPFFQVLMSDVDFKRFQAKFTEMMDRDRSDQRLSFACPRLLETAIDVLEDSLFQRWPVKNAGWHRQGLRWSLVVARQPGNESLALADVNTKVRRLYADVVKNIFVPDDAPAVLAARADWLQQKGQGDLAFDAKLDSLIGVRGAKLAVLNANDWFSADQVPLADLQKLIETDGKDAIPLSLFIEADTHGIKRPRATAPSLVIQTQEDRISVIRIRDAAGDDPIITSRPRPQRETDSVGVSIEPGKDSDATGNVASLPDKPDRLRVTDAPEAPVSVTDPKDTLHVGQPVDPVKELASLQGTWCFDVLQFRVWPEPIGIGTDGNGRISEKRWVVTGNQITWISQEGERIYVNFTIDPTKTPKQIDFTFLNGPHKGAKCLGVYEPQKGNANYLWLCLTNPGTNAPRPTDISYSSIGHQSMIGIYPVAPLEKPSVAKGLERFQGDWQMTLCDSTLRTFGATQQEAEKWQWTIKGDEIHWSRQGEVWKLKLDVDPSKRPREMDLTFLTGPFKNEKCLGMYEFGGVDGQSLMISLQDPGAKVPRPKAIEMRGDGKTSLIFLRPSKPSDTEREIGSFQGTWTLKNFDTASWPIPNGKGPDRSGEGSELRWTVKGNEITWTNPAGQEIKASFTIDSWKSPKQIDVTFLSGRDKGETCSGLYQRSDLDENILWLCMADPGSKTDRPTNFSYGPKQGRSLLSLYRLDSNDPSPADQISNVKPAPAPPKPMPKADRVSTRTPQPNPLTPQPTVPDPFADQPGNAAPQNAPPTRVPTGGRGKTGGLVVRVIGRILDDESGKPINNIAWQYAQLVPESKQTNWEVRLAHPLKDGNFDEMLHESYNYQRRVMAAGYEPAFLLEELPNPLPDPPVIKRTIRLKKGRLITGVLRDHLGQTVANAKVFFIPKGHRAKLTEGFPGWRNQFPGPSPAELRDNSVSEDLTNDKGEFEFHAAGAGTLAASTDFVDLWPFDLPAEGQPAELQLPAPATLTIDLSYWYLRNTLMDSDGPDDEKRGIPFVPDIENPEQCWISAERIRTGQPIADNRWDSIDYSRQMLVYLANETNTKYAKGVSIDENQTSSARENIDGHFRNTEVRSKVSILMPPGKYVIGRYRTGDIAEVVLKAGEKARLNWTRGEGAAVRGTVKLPANSVFQPPNAPAQKLDWTVLIGPHVTIKSADGKVREVIRINSDGTFLVATHLQPGRYTILATADLPPDGILQRITLPAHDGPDLEAQEELLIPEVVRGPAGPPPVRVELTMTSNDNRIVPAGSAEANDQVKNIPHAEAEPPPAGAAKVSPPNGLEFLKRYPRLHGLSLDMTELQFIEISRHQAWRTTGKLVEKATTYSFPLGDGHSLIVMFDKDAKCSGIQRVWGEFVYDEAGMEKPVTEPTLGTLSGRFVYDGPLPIPKTIRPKIGDIPPGVDADLIAALNSPEEASLLVAKDGGIANVVVWAVSHDIPWTPRAPLSPVTIHLKDDRYSPRITTVTVGQPLRVEIQDAGARNIRLDNLRNPSVNQVLTQEAKDRPLSLSFSEPEKMPRRYCSDIQPNPKGWLLIHSNPYVAISQPDGSFTLPSLPPGEWEFRVWHEREGKVQLWPKNLFKQTIKPGENKLGKIRLKFDFSAF